MQHAAVLDVRVVADANEVHVTANDGIHPNARIFAEHHVANQLCRLVDVTRRADLRHHTFIWSDHVIEAYCFAQAK
jgi:hypothetical protein